MTTPFNQNFQRSGKIGFEHGGLNDRARDLPFLSDSRRADQQDINSKRQLHSVARKAMRRAKKLGDFDTFSKITAQGAAMGLNVSSGIFDSRQAMKSIGLERDFASKQNAKDKAALDGSSNQSTSNPSNKPYFMGGYKGGTTTNEVPEFLRRPSGQSFIDSGVPEDGDGYFSDSDLDEEEESNSFYMASPYFSPFKSSNYGQGNSSPNPQLSSNRPLIDPIDQGVQKSGVFSAQSQLFKSLSGGASSKNDLNDPKRPTTDAENAARDFVELRKKFGSKPNFSVSHKMLPDSNKFQVSRKMLAPNKIIPNIPSVGDDFFNTSSGKERKDNENDPAFWVSSNGNKSDDAHWASSNGGKADDAFFGKSSGDVFSKPKSKHVKEMPKPNDARTGFKPIVRGIFKPPTLSYFTPNKYSFSRIPL